MPHSSSTSSSSPSNNLSKLPIRTVLLLFIFLLATVKYASAQGASVYFGAGNATDTPGTSPGCASHFLFDALTQACEPAPSMGGVFGVFGADFMITPHLGVNGEYAFRFSQANYLSAVGLKDRPAFYDVNVVYQPFSVVGRLVPVLEGGLGGARVSLILAGSPGVSFVQQLCNALFGAFGTCQSDAFPSANHFQLHGAFGVKLYVTGNVFLKPQFDVHWVRNLTQQFGRDVVPQYTLSLGYTLGKH
jgi:hypothetical protein